MISAIIIGIPVGVVSGVLCSLVISRAQRTKTQVHGVRLSCQCVSVDRDIPFFSSMLHDKLLLRRLTRKRPWDAKDLKPMKTHQSPGGIWTHSVGEALGEPEWSIPLEAIYFNVLNEIKYREECLGFPPWREHETWELAEELGLDTSSEGDMQTLRTGLMKIVHSPYIFYADIRFRKTGFPEMHDVHLTIEGEGFLNELSEREWGSEDDD